MIYATSLLGFKAAVQQVKLKLEAGCWSFTVYTEFGIINVTADTKSEILSLRHGKGYFVEGGAEYSKRDQIKYSLVIQRVPDGIVQEIIIAMALADIFSRYCTGTTIMKNRREMIILLMAAYIKGEVECKSIRDIEMLSEKIAKCCSRKSRNQRALRAKWAPVIVRIKECIEFTEGQIYGQWADLYHCEPPHLTSDSMYREFFMILWFYSEKNLPGHETVEFFKSLDQKSINIVSPGTAIMKYFMYARSNRNEEV